MPDQPQLVRGLNLRDTTALVVGTIIGTGVFLKASVMAQHVGTPALVLVVWIAAGLLSLAGALTYAELGTLLPHAGGEYVFLRAAYGNLAGFLFGWMRLLIAGTGSIAAYGAALAAFLSGLVAAKPDLAAAYNQIWAQTTFSLFGETVKWRFGPPQIVAVGVIVVFSALNCARVVVGGRMQSLLTFAKLAGIATIIVGVFVFGKGATWAHLAAPFNTPGWCGFSAFGMAMLAALWAYDGWNNMLMVAGEVRNPARNIPRALIFGMFIVLLTYGSINLAYHYALPVGEIAAARSTAHPDALPVASKAAQTFLGENGPALVSVIFILSTLGTLNGSILTNARIPYAMALDGLLPAWLGTLNAKTSVPVAAIVVQGVWAGVLALSGTFDQLTDYVIFASWIFYGATTASVFVLRRRMPESPRPYRTLGYPWVPLLFVLVAAWLTINTLVTARTGALIGLALIALGVPVYRWRRAKGRGASNIQHSTFNIE